MSNDSSERSGFSPPGLPLVSWGVQFADLDLNGLEDAVITSGRMRVGRRKPGLVLHNRGALRARSRHLSRRLLP